MSFFPSFPPPPPLPPPSFSTTVNGGRYDDRNNNVGFISDNNSNNTSSPTSSIVITIIVISSAIIISATIYILLRFLSRRSSPDNASPNNMMTLQNHINRRSSSLSSSSSSTPSNNNIFSESDHRALDSLPLFTFKSLNGNLTGKECAVCLSKFEKEDELRLLPLCCHAFHSQCIDAWVLSNESCPLCRSTVYPTDADVMNRVMAVTQNVDIINDHTINNFGDGSSVRSHGGDGRRQGSDDSVGSFGYILGDSYEIPLDSIIPRRRGSDLDKETTDDSSNVVGPPGERLDADVVGGSGRNWLREYMERFASFSSSSRTMSFRSSGRFFSGSCRRNDVVVPVDDEDLEANNTRAGQDITELFRWISGV